jgi:hypothetical protein
MQFDRNSLGKKGGVQDIICFILVWLTKQGEQHHSYILGEVLSDRWAAFYCLDLVQSLWQQHVHMWQVAQQILPVCLVGPPAATIRTGTPIEFAALHLNQNLLLYLSVACFL